MSDSSHDFDRLLDRSGTGSIKWGSAAGDQLAMGLQVPNIHPGWFRLVVVVFLAVAVAVRAR